MIMSWFYGKYACGHEGRVNIYGPEKDRKWKAEKEFKKVCPECWKKQYEEKIINASSGLPELTGTPKQVEWATNIRAKMKIELEKNMNYYKGKVEIKGLNFDEQVQKLFAQSNSVFWIENRSEYLVDLLRNA